MSVWGDGGSMFQLNLKRNIYKLLDVRPGKEFLGFKYIIYNMKPQFKFCQAQPKLQVKLSLKAELALFPFNPAGRPAARPPARPSGIVVKKLEISKLSLVTIIGLVYEAKMIIGRRPHYFCKWKTTSTFPQMEDDLNFWKMEDEFNL